jgi:hypothetical protein
MEEVELHVAATAEQLRLPIGVAPGFVHPAPQDRRIGFQEGEADIAREGEVRLGPAAGRAIPSQS